MKNEIKEMSFQTPHHASSRNVAVRDIGVGHFNPALQPCGVTNGTGGFTLVELLVVVLIIGILAAVALPQYNKAVEKSRLTEGIVLLRSLVQAEQAFFMEHGTYTTDFNDLDIGFNVSATKPDEAYSSHCSLQIWRAISHNIVYAQSYPGTLWYLYYDLSQEKLFCGSRDERGKALCKSIGKGEEQGCGTKGTMPCWEVKP